MNRDQIRDALLEKYVCVKNLYRDLQTSNCAKESQLNWAEPREVKDNP